MTKKVEPTSSSRWSGLLMSVVEGGFVVFGVEGPSKLPKWGVVVGSGLLYLLDGSGHLYLSAGFSSTPARCQLTSDPGACAADQAFHSDTRARHAANGVARLIDAAVPSGSASILWEFTCVREDRCPVLFACRRCRWPRRFIRACDPDARSYVSRLRTQRSAAKRSTRGLA